MLYEGERATGRKVSEVIRRRETTSGTRSVSGQTEDRWRGRGGKMKPSMEVRKTEKERERKRERERERGRVEAAETPFGNSTFENSESHLKFAPRSRHLSHFP